MTTRESVSLASLTTFRIGGPAAYVVDCESESDVRDAIAFAREHALPFVVLGGGSNVLAPDDGYAGVVIRPHLTRLSFDERDDGVLAIAEAGVPWDAFVREACMRSLWGVENLAGIPGSVGAAPIQNIGAYGAEVAETVEWVEVLDPETGDVTRVSNADCAFGYRDSRFKRNPGTIILRVAFLLKKDGAPRIGYADLARAQEQGTPLTTPSEIAAAVRAIRAKKFPDLSHEGTAGSFFKNPHITAEAFAALKERYPELPGFPSGALVKVPLAWILDRVLNLRGFTHGNARLYEAQPLVLATTFGARAEEVRALAALVNARVKETTGIELEWEVRELA
ncbi:MAG TPA: UDP-N-acetylmuramate dehydrogenase [Candidatus Paceibacterota bacterium]|nr:UDP-N-acetylmuramate dehydrogenase [Candidatus Paceibacterota bacterium]